MYKIYPSIALLAWCELVSQSCSAGRCSLARQGVIHNHEIERGSSEFDDLLIPLFNQRISQEFNNISSTEIKANIIIVTCVALFAIFLVPVNAINFEKIAEPGPARILIPIIMISFISAFFLALLVVFPRGRTRMIIPRKMNNILARESVTNAKNTIKEDLIKNFEFIERHRIRDTNYLMFGYILLSIGFSAIVIGLLFIDIR